MSSVSWHSSSTESTRRRGSEMPVHTQLRDRFEALLVPEDAVQDEWNLGDDPARLVEESPNPHRYVFSEVQTEDWAAADWSDIVRSVGLSGVVRGAAYNTVLLRSVHSSYNYVCVTAPEDTERNLEGHGWAPIKRRAFNLETRFAEAFPLFVNPEELAAPPVAKQRYFRMPYSALAFSTEKPPHANFLRFLVAGGKLPDSHPSEIKDRLGVGNPLSMFWSTRFGLLSTGITAIPDSEAVADPTDITVSTQAASTSLGFSFYGAGGVQRLEEMEGKLQEFSALPQNWDAQGAPPISPFAIDEGRRILTAAIVLGLPTPWVAAGGDGGIGIQWESDHAELYIDIVPGEETTYVFTPKTVGLYEADGVLTPANRSQVLAQLGKSTI